MELNKKSKVVKHISDIKIYRDTLDYIIAKFKANHLEVKISLGDYIFDSIDDLVQNRGSKIPMVTIIGRKLDGGLFDDISVYFNYDECTIISYGSENILLIAHEIVNEIKYQRSNTIQSIIKQRPTLMVYFLTIIWLFFTISLLKSKLNSVEYWILFSLGILAINLVVYGLRRLIPSLSVDIELKKKYEFDILESSRDKILLDISKFMVGGIAGYFIKTIIDGFNK